MPQLMFAVEWDVFSNIIDGKQRNSKTQHHGVNPSTGEQLWTVPLATKSDLDDAVRSARRAFESFSQTSLEERKMLLSAFRDCLLANAERMTDLLCAETGKPPSVAEWETKGIAEWFDHHLALQMPEERVEDEEKIIIPAVLTGNAIIVKPSPFSPYSTLKIVELAQSIFEPGVIQALGGDDNLGPMMTSDQDIAKISFTGSTHVGKKLMAACAGTVKHVTLEPGGNDACIVRPDVDIAATAMEVATGAFQNSGQICVGTKRIYIHDDIYDDFLKEMVKYTEHIDIGNPESGALMGPIQNSMQFDRVKEFFRDTKVRGYQVATGEPYIDTSKGFFILPAIVDNPPDESLIVTEEPFGPIVPTLRWRDEDDVIRRANDTTTGLGASVWSKDVARAERLGTRPQCGSVWINSYGKPSPMGYFRGHKESGIGGEWGTEGLRSYCNAQVMHTYKS